MYSRHAGFPAVMNASLSSSCQHLVDVGQGTGGEVRLGAEQGDGRQDGAGDWRRLRKRRCRRGIKTVSSALANPGHCRPRWDKGTRKGQKLE